METCTYPNCSKPQNTRGLCINHYMMVRHLVKSKKTTWSELEKRKKILPKKVRTFSKEAEWFLT